MNPAGPTTPVTLLSLGRSGSTATMAALRAHPDIFVAGPPPYEQMVCQFWARTYAALASADAPVWNPGDPQHVLSGIPFLRVPSDHPDRELLAELRRAEIAAAADFCRGRAEYYYQKMAARAQKRPRFVLEKMPVGITLRPLYVDAPTIVLVRDFRDTMASMLAFDKKRGFHGFGRQTDEPVLAYVHRVAARAAKVAAHYQVHVPLGLTIRFDHLMAEPEEALRPVLAALGLPADASTMGAMVQSMQMKTTFLAQHRTSSETVSTRPGAKAKRDLEPELYDAVDTAMRGPNAAIGITA